LWLAVAALFSAWMALKAGQLQLAEGWVEDDVAQRVNHSLPPLFRDEADLLVARVRMAQARWAEAEEALRELINRTSNAGRHKVTIEAMALLALVLQAEQRPDSACEALLNALTLAQPGNFILTFVDEGEPMRHLLREAKPVVRRSSRRKGLTAYVDRLLLALGEKVEKANGLTEPLTAREKEVLQLLVQGATNRQIAVRLAVSAGTVKAHTNHIFGKLGARNRTEAAARARELALLEE
jgi:LuxR family maltose regulon positive regulatory protein